MTMSGGLVWITGLPGVGKSTLAMAVAARLRAGGQAVVVLDGDVVRGVLGEAGRGYDLERRRELALTYSRLGAWLAGQGMVVVAAVVALFDIVHVANRTNGLPYLEVWLRAPEPLRAQRSAERDAEGPKVGVDLVAEWPRAAHLVLDNDDQPATVQRHADAIVAAWQEHADGRG